MLGPVIECLRDDPDERNRRTERVAHRGIAAARIPSKEAIGRKSQSHDTVLSLHKLERSGRDLDDVGTAAGIKQVGTAKLMRIRLAIVAVANNAIHCSRRWVRDRSADLPAAAA
jgi:hypothetical protein